MKAAGTSEVAVALSARRPPSEFRKCPYDGLLFFGLEDPGCHLPGSCPARGSTVFHDSGIPESELGSNLREELDFRDSDEPRIVLLHQPRSADGYILGARSTRDVGAAKPQVRISCVGQSHINAASGSASRRTLQVTAR